MMMTPLQHYQEAENLMERAAGLERQSGDRSLYSNQQEHLRHMAISVRSEAQVHAILATVPMENLR